jgi:hypothetical protein
VRANPKANSTTATGRGRAASTAGSLR